MKYRKKYRSVIFGSLLAALALAELMPEGAEFAGDRRVSADPVIRADSYAAMNLEDGTIYLDEKSGEVISAGSAEDLLMLMTILERGLNPEGSLPFGDVALARLKDQDPVVDPKVKAGEEFSMPDAIKALLCGGSAEFRYQFSEGYAPSQEEALLGMIGEKITALSLEKTKVNSFDLSEDQACLSSAAELMTVMKQAVSGYPVLETALKVPSQASVSALSGEAHQWIASDLLTGDKTDGLEYAFVLHQGSNVIGQISIAKRGDLQIVTSCLGTGEQDLSEVTSVLIDEAYLKAYEPLFRASEENFLRENDSKGNVSFSEETALRAYPSLSSEVKGRADAATVLTYAGAAGDWKRLKTSDGEYVYTQAATFVSDAALTATLPAETQPETESAPEETGTQEEITESKKEPEESKEAPTGNAFEEQEHNRSAILAARMARQKKQKILTYVAIGAIILSLAGLFYLHFR